MRSSHFVRWLGHLLAGFALLMGGLEIVRICWGSWELVVCGLAASIGGLGAIVRAEFFERLSRLKRKARRALTFPRQWAVKFDKSVHQGTVIPVAVTRADGVRFVIDILGHKELKWTNPLVYTDRLLMGPGGERLTHDPAAPLLQAAATWGATAVLWLPEAVHARNLRREGTNLIVVMGPASELKNALRGAEIVQVHPASEPKVMVSKHRAARKTAPISAPQLQT